ncbi:MAG: fused MFS/spermidine synthase, partial [Gammaproteobacteria bacterium]|nr:fused MFS/spermidine synthase [Gammaproteobacteria bacterium]
MKYVALLMVLVAPSALADRVIHTERSLYRNIAVIEDGDTRCLTFTSKRRNSRQSCIDLEEPDRLVLPYLPMVFAGLTVNPQPQSVLIIGLGGGTIADVFGALYPGIEVDAVEIDPAVVDVAREYFGYSERPGATVHVRDGRVFVRRATRERKRYDYIVLDAFNGDYIPEHLMTADFLKECQQLLTENGVLVANTFSSSRLYDSESQTYATVFGDFLNLRRRLGNRVIVAAADGR